MNRWAVYEPSGRIDSVFSGLVSNAVMQAEGDLSIAPIAEGLDDLTAYVVGGVVLEKQSFPLSVSPAQIAADGLDTATISGIPTGTQVEWPDGQTDTVTDGIVEFSVDLPGTYTLKFSAIPYLDQEVTIEALPAA